MWSLKSSSLEVPSVSFSVKLHMEWLPGPEGKKQGIAMAQILAVQRRTQERSVVFRSIDSFERENHLQLSGNLLLFLSQWFPGATTLELVFMTMCGSVWAGQPPCSAFWRMKRLKFMLMPEQTAAVDRWEFLDAFLITCLPPVCRSASQLGNGGVSPRTLLWGQKARLFSLLFKISEALKH